MVPCNTDASFEDGLPTIEASFVLSIICQLYVNVPAEAVTIYGKLPLVQAVDGSLIEQAGVCAFKPEKLQRRIKKNKTNRA